MAEGDAVPFNFINELRLGVIFRIISAADEAPEEGDIAGPVDEVEPNGYELIIEWDLPEDDKYPHDWFTKE